MRARARSVAIMTVTVSLRSRLYAKTGKKPSSPLLPAHEGVHHGSCVRICTLAAALCTRAHEIEQATEHAPATLDRVSDTRASTTAREIGSVTSTTKIVTSSPNGSSLPSPFSFRYSRLQYAIKASLAFCGSSTAETIAAAC